MKTIRNSEELRGGALEQLEKARDRLRKIEMEADQFRVNGYSEIEREKLNLINRPLLFKLNRFIFVIF